MRNESNSKPNIKSTIRDAISPDVENMIHVEHQIVAGGKTMSPDWEEAQRQWRDQLQHLDDLKDHDKPIDADAILTDDQLERGGLVKVEAFMRTRTSAAAARKAKQRDRDESEGLRQVNIKTTEENGTALKSIVAEIGRGATLVDAIVKAVPSVTSHALVTATDPETERLAEIGRKAEALTGWKRVLAKFLGVLS